MKMASSRCRVSKEEKTVVDLRTSKEELLRSRDGETKPEKWYLVDTSRGVLCVAKPAAAARVYDVARRNDARVVFVLTTRARRARRARLIDPQICSPRALDLRRTICRQIALGRFPVAAGTSLGRHSVTGGLLGGAGGAAAPGLLGPGMIRLRLASRVDESCPQPPKHGQEMNPTNATPTWQVASGTGEKERRKQDKERVGLSRTGEES